MVWRTEKELKLFQYAVQSGGFVIPAAFGLGIANLNSYGEILDTWYPVVHTGSERADVGALLASVFEYRTGNATYLLETRHFELLRTHFASFTHKDPRRRCIDIVDKMTGVSGFGGNPKEGRKSLVACFIGSGESDTGTNSVPDAYLRLHLLSRRQVPPGLIRLDGAEEQLPFVAHTSQGPIALEDITERGINSLTAGRSLVVYSRGKFPRMLNYVVPPDVTIEEGAYIELGAHLATDTIVLRTGAVRYNSGTLDGGLIAGPLRSGQIVDYNHYVDSSGHIKHR